MDMSPTRPVASDGARRLLTNIGALIALVTGLFSALNVHFGLDRLGAVIYLVLFVVAAAAMWPERYMRQQARPNPAHGPISQSGLLALGFIFAGFLGTSLIVVIGSFIF